MHIRGIPYGLKYAIYLPLNDHVMLGAGAPSASQGMVASFPSMAVRFVGGLVNTGEEAVITEDGN